MASGAAALVVGVLGLVIGSFLNVCIWRLPSLVLEQDDADSPVRGIRGLLLWQRDVWRDVGRALARLSSPPSSCPTCESQIAWYHNVPLLGWLYLRGRCATCRAPISFRYPLIEAITALTFLLNLAVFGWGPLLAVRLVLAAALIVLFAIDLDHQLLPDVITIPGLFFGLGASMFLPPGPIAAVLGVLIGGGTLWVIAEVYFRWRHIEGLGFGDVKMLAMIGAFLGWQGTLITLLLGSLSGALLGVILIASGRASMGLKLPFGTFLALGALVASLWGDTLASWYFSLYAGPA